MYYERKTRTYFDYELYKTELFVKVVETNENPVESAIKSILTDQFYLQGTETIEMAAGTLAGLVQEQKRVKNVSEKTVVKRKPPGGNGFITQQRQQNPRRYTKQADGI